LQPLQWRNSHDRPDWKLLLVAHRVAACGTQLKTFHEILSRHLSNLAR
jgi:hypothetical protein